MFFLLKKYFNHCGALSENKLGEIILYLKTWGGGVPAVVVSTAAFHARVPGSVPGPSGLKEIKNVSSPSVCESQYCGEFP